MPSILVVDDEANIRSSLSGVLSREGHQVDTAGSLADARRFLREAYDVVLLDVRFPEGNGLEATDPAGHVRVTAHAELDHLRLAVSDDGPGLTPEQEEQLFVPGFTTKAHGSGLGLTLVERIVTDHGGTLEVESAPGAGTTFVIRLPLLPEA